MIFLSSGNDVQWCIPNVWTSRVVSHYPSPIRANRTDRRRLSDVWTCKEGTSDREWVMHSPTRHLLPRSHLRIALFLWYIVTSSLRYRRIMLGLRRISFCTNQSFPLHSSTLASCLPHREFVAWISRSRSLMIEEQMCTLPHLTPIHHVFTFKFSKFHGSVTSQLFWFKEYWCLRNSQIFKSLKNKWVPSNFFVDVGNFFVDSHMLCCEFGVWRNYVLSLQSHGPSSSCIYFKHFAWML